MYRHNKTHTHKQVQARALARAIKRLPSRDGPTEMEWERTNEPIYICYLFHCASFCSSYAILLMRWHGASEICAQKNVFFLSRNNRIKGKKSEREMVVDVSLSMCQRSFCYAWYHCHRYTHIHVCHFSSISYIRISQSFYNANAFNWSRK